MSGDIPEDALVQLQSMSSRVWALYPACRGGKDELLFFPHFWGNVSRQFDVLFFPISGVQNPKVHGPLPSGPRYINSLFHLGSGRRV